MSTASRKARKRAGEQFTHTPKQPTRKYVPKSETKPEKAYGFDLGKLLHAQFLPERWRP